VPNIKVSGRFVLRLFSGHMDRKTDTGPIALHGHYIGLSGR